MKVYKPDVVLELEAFYGDLLFEVEKYPSIKAHLAALAARMWEGVQLGNASILREISNYHPKYLGRTNAALSKIQLSEKDCRRTIAKEYGYRRWDSLSQFNHSYNSDYEAAVNAMLEGNLKELQKLMKDNKEMVNQKSQYGHKATLLHYAVSNGVELWRQKVPYNLIKIVSYLLDLGADKTAKMKVYGGEYMATELIMSSAHPKEVGIRKELRKLLEVSKLESH